MTHVVFDNLNLCGKVDNNISYLKFTIYGLKNISNRPEVQRIGAPKSPKCDSNSTGMFMLIILRVDLFVHFIKKHS